MLLPHSHSAKSSASSVRPLSALAFAALNTSNHSHSPSAVAIKVFFHARGWVSCAWSTAGPGSVRFKRRTKTVRGTDSPGAGLAGATACPALGGGDYGCIAEHSCAVPQIIVRADIQFEPSSSPLRGEHKCVSGCGFYGVPDRFFPTITGSGTNPRHPQSQWFVFFEPH